MKKQKTTKIGFSILAILSIISIALFIWGKCYIAKMEVVKTSQIIPTVQSSITETEPVPTTETEPANTVVTESEVAIESEPLTAPAPIFNLAGEKGIKAGQLRIKSSVEENYSINVGVNLFMEDNLGFDQVTVNSRSNGNWLLIQGHNHEIKGMSNTSLGNLHTWHLRRDKNPDLTVNGTLSINGTDYQLELVGSEIIAGPDFQYSHENEEDWAIYWDKYLTEERAASICSDAEGMVTISTCSRNFVQKNGKKEWDPQCFTVSYFIVK